MRNRYWSSQYNVNKITIFINGKAKTGTCDWPDRSTAIILAILVTKKAKTTKDIFDKKPLLPAYL